MTLSAPHLLLLVSASMERQLRAFSCSPGALSTAHDGILWDSVQPNSPCQL